MTVTATYQFDWREHYRASREVARRLWTRWLGWLTTAIFLGVAFMNYRQATGRVSSLAVFFGMLPWLVLAALYVALTPYTQWRAAKKLPSRDVSVQGLQQRTIDAAGFHSRGNGVSLDIPWHAMLRGVETKDFFLLFYNKRCAYYFPKRLLDSAAIEEARGLIKQGLGDWAELL